MAYRPDQIKLPMELLKKKSPKDYQTEIMSVSLRAMAFWHCHSLILYLGVITTVKTGRAVATYGWYL